MRGPTVGGLGTVKIEPVYLAGEGDLPSLVISTEMLPSSREACTFLHHSDENASCIRNGTNSSPSYFETSRSISGVRSRIYFESINLAVLDILPSVLTPGNASHIST